MSLLPSLTLLALAATPHHSQDIDSVVRTFTAKHLFNGNVLVLKQGKTLFQKSYGMANMELNVRNSPRTKFRIGSVSKQFTAMLIMMLKQEGKLDLNAKLTDVLPWYRKDTGDKITIHHLLTHEAGIPNFTTNEAFADLDNNDYTRQQVAEKYCSGNLEFEPGSKFKYNNADYYLLGCIIETLEKKSFTEVLHEKILKPLGMNDSGVDNWYFLEKNRASGYTYFQGEYQNVQGMNPDATVFTAGSLISTCGDMAKYQSALFGGKLLNAENLALFLKPNLGNYAYGTYVNTFTPKGMASKVTAIGHNGGIRGFSTSMIRFAEDDMTIILLDNSTTHTRGNIEEITMGIYKALKK
ncbi:MAG TPA: serine hydrolase domain-containing protein [Fimbriimonas sp.]|nr:serine hydrolase domain-containing protein [Fimbriimonas sp.]